MSDVHLRRLTAISGCTAFILYVVSALLIIDAPGVDSAPGALTAYAAAHSASLLLEVVVWGPITCAVVTFAAGLWALLRRAEGEPSVLATLTLIALLVTQTLVLAGFPELLVLGYRAGSLSPSEARLLFDLTYLGIALSAFPTVLAMSAYAALVLRTLVFPRWTAWLALLVAVLHVIAGVSFASSGLFSPSGMGVYLAPPAFFVWMLAVSIVAVRKGRRTRAAISTGAAMRPAIRA